MIPTQSAGVSGLGASSKRLTARTVLLRDAMLSNATLVPLFDAGGVTVKVALLAPRTRECWVLGWRPGLVKVPLFRKTRVDIMHAERQGAGVFGPLWLYDVGGLAALALTSLCPDLPVRNAADCLPENVQGLRWRRDLSKICAVQRRDKGGSYSDVKWDPQWLADAEEKAVAMPLSRQLVREVAPVPNPGKIGWVLDPVWAR